jgi:hypothetical protein
MTTTLPTPRSWIDRALPWIIGIAASGLAIWQLAVFRQHSEQLWYWPTHDRNCHYYLGLSLATSVRSFDLGQLGYDLDSGGRTWGMLHAVLVGIIELFAGGDFRWAVLPSLAGWVASAVLMFLVGRRLVPRAGTAAGLIAALFFMASPAYRAFSTDIMLESLGGTLSLLVLLRYLIAIQDDSPNAGRWLGLALSAIFFLKYNYWLLVFAGVLLGEFSRQPRVYLAIAKRYLSVLAHRDLWLRQLRRPMTYVILALVGVILFIAAVRHRPVEIFGRTHIWHSAENVVSVTYWLLFLRFWRWYRREGHQEVATWDIRWQQAFRWHGLVVAWYFLWPKRLSYFVWFLSPFNNGTERAASSGFLHGLPAYMQGLRDEYHVAGWMLVVTLALAAVALVLWRRTRTGAGALLAFVFVAAFLTFQHPMWKHRFMHSWADGIWLLAGAGVALTATLLGRISKVRPEWFAAPCVPVAAWFLIPSMVPPGIAFEGGMRFDRLSFLTLHKTYLPSLAESRDCTIVCNVPVWFSTDWTMLEHYGRRIRWSNHINDYARGNESDQAVLTNWHAESKSDTVVVIDIAKTSPFYEPTGDTLDLGPLRRFLESRPNEFHLEETWELKDDVVITRWSRTQP